MSICASCGLQMPNGSELCDYHHASSYGDDWASNNRIMCALIHRHADSPRLSESEREDSVVAGAESWA